LRPARRRDLVPGRAQRPQGADVEGAARVPGEGDLRGHPREGQAGRRGRAGDGRAEPGPHGHPRGGAPRGRRLRGAVPPGSPGGQGLISFPAMPELPDLLYIQARLKEALVGRRVTGERLREPVVMRFAVRGNLSLLLGRKLDAVIRHAHFLVFRFEDLDLAVNPMLAGRFRLAEPDEKEERDLVFLLEFDSGAQLRYRDEKNMGKAYLLARGDWKAAPGMDQ